MCKTETCCNSNKKCVCRMIAKILVVIGGINWGLVGIGMLLGKEGSLNLVNMLLGGMPKLEAIVYVVVGISAIMMLGCCKHKKCGEGSKSCCDSKETAEVKQ